MSIKFTSAVFLIGVLLFSSLFYVSSLPVFPESPLTTLAHKAVQALKNRVPSNPPEVRKLYIRSSPETPSNTSRVNTTAGVTRVNLDDKLGSAIGSLLNTTALTGMLSNLTNAKNHTEMLAIHADTLKLNLSSLTNETWSIPAKNWTSVSFNGTINNMTVVGILKNLTYALVNVTLGGSSLGTNDTIVLPIFNFTTLVDPKVSGANESQIRPLPWLPKPLNGSDFHLGIGQGQISDISHLDPTLEWKKVIADDFSKGLSKTTWTVLNSCQLGQLTCFKDRPENVKTFNNSLIITPMAERKSKPLQYTSGRVYSQFVWPSESSKFTLWINAALPNVDSVVPILKLIVNGTIVIDLTSPQVTTNSSVVLGRAYPAQNRDWQVTIDRNSGVIQFGDNGFNTMVPALRGPVPMSIVLSSIIRTSEWLPNGPLLWFGPSEDKDAMSLFKRQYTDQGLLDIWTLTIYGVKAFYSST